MYSWVCLDLMELLINACNRILVLNFDLVYLRLVFVG